MGPGVRHARSWAAASVVALGLTFLLRPTGGDVVHPRHETHSPHGDACATSAYTLDGPRQHHTFIWAVNVSSIPKYLNRGQALRAIENATETIAEVRTPCHGGRGSADLPRVIYAGPTERQANVTPSAQCFPTSNTDGINVVSFGKLPKDVVAVTCNYSYRGDIWQSDIMLNDAPGVFTTNPSSPSCTAYDLQAVMTHERGHSFGLGHVPEDPATGGLTMSAMMGRCDDSARTLGGGDVAGLDHIY